MGRQPQGRFCTFRSFRAGDSDGCCRNDLIHGPIADNLSAHKTTRVKEFLHLHPNVKLHFTPTYSSWLNQVELWLSKIERDVIARGIFTSTDDLSRKLLRYIREYNKTARPIKWKYTDVSRRIRAPHPTVTVH